MAVVFADRTQETSTTTGTGTYDLAGAVTGFQTFVAGIGTANTCYYTATDSINWEVGIGTVTDAAPDTLARTTILASSNAGAAVSWAAGTRNIFCTIPAARVLDEFIIRQNATYTLASVGTEQQLFNASANGRLTLATGTYLFDSLFSLSSMSATDGNCAWDILGAGTATVGSVLYIVHGRDIAINTITGSPSLQVSNAAQTTGVNMVAPLTNTDLQAYLSGTFEVTAAGTIQPSVTLTTAAAAIVAIGSYFRCRRIGSDTMTTVGQWD